MNKKIREIAIAEILNPIFDLTRQILAVNKVVYENIKPFKATGINVVGT